MIYILKIWFSILITKYLSVLVIGFFIGLLIGRKLLYITWKIK
jgi:hypothetical protein